MRNHKKSGRVIILGGKKKSKNIFNCVLEHFGPIGAVQGLYIRVKTSFYICFITPHIILLKKQLLFELLVPSLGRYVPMQHTEYDLRTVGGEGKTNDVFKFSYHF